MYRIESITCIHLHQLKQQKQILYTFLDLIRKKYFLIFAKLKNF